MAFPLAHPAAVLPLRRYCPQRLNFPALIIGSLTPDAGYLFDGYGVDVFSHQALGSIGFCLPAGILMLAAFYALRSRAVRFLPEPYQRALLPLCQRPMGSIWVVLISLMIGTWTHLLWDWCTHKDGWVVQQIPVLQQVLFSVEGRKARVCYLLWYASSFAGLIWLVLVFEKWKRQWVKGSAGASRKVALRDAVLVALLLVPIELVHHGLARQELLLYLVAALCMLPAIWILLRAQHTAGGDAASAPAAEAGDAD